MSKTCCPENSLPFLAEDASYEPKGEMIEFSEVSAYIVGSGPIGIIFIHDIFGLPSGMNKLLCDTIAAKVPNATVIAPDFFRGDYLCRDDPLVERGSALQWKVIWSIMSCRVCGYIQKYSWDNCAEDIFNKVTAHLISSYNVERFITLGFCWGAYVGWKACVAAQHKDKIVANMSCHPSVHSICSMVKDNQMTILNGVTCPQLVIATKDEPADWKPNGLVQKALADKEFADANEFHLYDQESHGFVPRGDTNIEHTKVAIGEVINKIVCFVNKVAT